MTQETDLLVVLHNTRMERERLLKALEVTNELINLAQRILRRKKKDRRTHD